MKYYAEYVSMGHPDRLCDQIVESIVTYVVSIDSRALCGIECAVHTNKVFIDGRIAGGKGEKIIDEEKIKELVRKVYKEAGYGKHLNSLWHPFPEELEIILDVCIEPLVDEERMLRSYSDDQNIVTGYAINYEETNYLPVAHFLANYIGKSLPQPNNEMIGPDYKVLVQLNYNKKWSWERLTISVQHDRKIAFKDIFQIIKNNVIDTLNKLENTTLADLSKLDDEQLYVNGAGDFIQGGPEGDNGLSGKKLCIDFYGPDVPIGGGAICGKDPHKIDVCGAFRARELAIKLVKEYGYYSVFTSLSWSPGEMMPYSINAFYIDEFGTKMEIDESLLPAKDWFSIDCINNDLSLFKLPRKDIVGTGYMFFKEKNK